MARFDDIDLSRLAPPSIIEALSYETIYQAILTDAVARLTAAGIPYDVETLETDPVAILCQAYAYREMLLRQRVNDAVKAVLLASSWGSNLDHLGALFATARQTGESDTRYRRRVQLAPEAFATMGSEGAYVYHALTAAPWARDATAIKLKGGHVQVTLLAETGEPTEAQITAVAAYMRDPKTLPLTHYVTVAKATARQVTIAADLVLYPGPDATVVVQRATAALNAWLTENRMIGRNLMRTQIIALLHVEGVHSVDLAPSVPDMVLGPTEVFRVTGVTVTSRRRDI